MSYIITNGDLEITKNVLEEVARRLGNSLASEIGHFEYETDCPSYNAYNNVIDTLVYIDSNRQDLTN